MQYDWQLSCYKNPLECHAGPGLWGKAEEQTIAQNDVAPFHGVIRSFPSRNRIETTPVGQDLLDPYSNEGGLASFG